MQQPNIPRVLGVNNPRAEENVSLLSRVDEARGSDTDINNRVNNLDDISLTNPPNPKVTEHREPANLNDKMLIRLGITFPNLTKYYTLLSMLSFNFETAFAITHSSFLFWNNFAQNYCLSPTLMVSSKATPIPKHNPYRNFLVL